VLLRSHIQLKQAIHRTIEGIQKVISPPDSPTEEVVIELDIQISPTLKRHFGLEIKTLREAPRDLSKLRKLLKPKQRECEDTMKIEELEGLVTEMEMLKLVLCVVLCIVKGIINYYSSYIAVTAISRFIILFIDLFNNLCRCHKLCFIIMAISLFGSMPIDFRSFSKYSFLKPSSTTTTTAGQLTTMS
jgi:hypothetical protein